MKLRKNSIRAVLSGTFLVAMAMLASLSFAQEKRGGGGQSHGGGGQRGGSRQGGHTGGGHSGGGHTGGGQARGGQARGGHTRGGQNRGGAMRGGQNRSAHTRSSGAGTMRTGGSTNRMAANRSRGAGGHQTARQGGGNRSGGTRSFRMSRGPTGTRGYTAASWRSHNPNWNGGYYYHNGGYFYDAGFTDPAIVTNEWLGIAAIAGGAALVGALDNDPTLVFAGSVGALFALSAYNADLNSSNGELRLRANYFGRPYFWRNGVRYDRIVVVQGGTRYYRFQRH
jgi:hypothetical protein